MKPMSTGISIVGDSDFSAIVSFTNSTNSTSTTTGALVITGGIGITGNSCLGNTTFTKAISTGTNSPIINNINHGSFTTLSLTTAVAGSQAITFTNNRILTTSVIQLNASTSGNGVPYPFITSTNSGSVNITIRNISTTAAFNNTIKINFSIF